MLMAHSLVMEVWSARMASGSSWLRNGIFGMTDRTPRVS